MLELKKINAGYGELQVLKNVNLHVNHGEIIALIGPNGAGKSTVIKSIFNLANINSGRVIFKEKDITNLKTHELVELGIAYVNQGKIVFGNLTVQENVEIGGWIANCIDEKMKYCAENGFPEALPDIEMGYGLRLRCYDLTKVAVKV